MKYLLSLGLLFITFIFSLPSNATDWPECSVISESCNLPNLIVNGSFEEGNVSTNSPDYWEKDAWQFSSEIFAWDDTRARTGDKSAKIDVSVINDARWIQTLNVDPDTWYLLSGWIKTDNVAHAAPGEVDAGANLMLFGTWERSKGIFGSQGWTYSSLLFNSEDETQATPGGRLGYWAGATTGTAWFDDLQLKPILPMDPHPNWKILVLIYQNTDFEMIDNNGIYHHYIASMPQDERDKAAQAAKDFAEIDVPVLSSGNMIPEITVRFPDRALTSLTAIASGWWPSQEDTAAELDPLFDSVIIIWDPRTTDTETGEFKWIGYADGLTAHVGAAQTYLSMQIDAAVKRGHRNVFKHEFGHSLVFHFDAMGLTPQPAVTNHATAGQYVNCETGEDYDWRDETLDEPIPNSIYNNESGFTHDYYSGMTAIANDPLNCLGISSEAWAFGGAVSNSGSIDLYREEIVIDIKPGSRRNIINPDHKGSIWLAILSDSNLDPSFKPSSDVDISSVEFGPSSAQAIRYKTKDINNDGIDDLFLRFKMAQSGIACGDTEASVIGKRVDGQTFTGTDAVKTVGCNNCKRSTSAHYSKSMWIGTTKCTVNKYKGKSYHFK